VVDEEWREFSAARLEVVVVSGEIIADYYF
jgi:hypothetical protein